ncbi:hypothetical protein R3P38DRAFT_2792126 [Favolaschia claudopus]|uniref:Uncharacterized protein n=1 Tax=Favolaschia claudopus TaxID=2862362 RepID=A0AAW0AFZ4_9AGAR
MSKLVLPGPPECRRRASRQKNFRDGGREQAARKHRQTEFDRSYTLLLSTFIIVFRFAGGLGWGVSLLIRRKWALRAGISAKTTNSRNPANSWNGRRVPRGCGVNLSKQVTWIRQMILGRCERRQGGGEWLEKSSLNQRWRARRGLGGPSRRFCDIRVFRVEGRGIGGNK